MEEINLITVAKKFKKNLLLTFTILQLIIPIGIASGIYLFVTSIIMARKLYGISLGNLFIPIYIGTMISLISIIFYLLTKAWIPKLYREEVERIVKNSSKLPFYMKSRKGRFVIFFIAFWLSFIVAYSIIPPFLSKILNQFYLELYLSNIWYFCLTFGFIFSGMTYYKYVTMVLKIDNLYLRQGIFMLVFSFIIIATMVLIEIPNNHVAISPVVAFSYYILLGILNCLISLKKVV